jgi:hypothetical protein
MDGMGGPYSMHRKPNAHKIVVGKPYGEKLIVSPGSWWEDNGERGNEPVGSIKSKEFFD